MNIWIRDKKTGGMRKYDYILTADADNEKPKGKTTKPIIVSAIAWAAWLIVTVLLLAAALTPYIAPLLRHKP